LLDSSATDRVVSSSVPIREPIEAAYDFVDKVLYEVITADATQTMSIGDGSGTSSYIADADVATAGNTGHSALTLTEATPNTVTGYTGGKFYSAADTIDLLVPSGKVWDTLKVRVYAICTILGVA